MRAAFLIAALALTVGCDSDSDSDGLTNAEEEALGTNPDAVDTDGDGLSDFVEARTLGTDPTVADTDADGLDDGAEVTLGTDPAAADSDADGFNDGEEVEDETDPLDALSYIRGTDGRWPALSARVDTSIAEGYALGDRFPNLIATDQFGQEVELYDFAGNVIMVDFSATWCGPCRTVASKAEAEYRARAESGFVILHFMSDADDGAGGPSVDVLEGWADQYGLTFPVAFAPEEGDALGGLQAAGLYRGAIPFMILLDRDMTLAQAATGSGAEHGLLSMADILVQD